MNRRVILIVAILFAVARVHAQVVLIANPSVPVRSLEAHAILDIYSMNTREWPDGAPVSVFTLKSNDATSQRFYSFLGTRLLDMKKIWMRIQLSGEGTTPEPCFSDEEVVEKVAATPGAVGYVRMSSVKGSVIILAEIE